MLPGRPVPDRRHRDLDRLGERPALLGPHGRAPGHRRPRDAAARPRPHRARARARAAHRLLRSPARAGPPAGRLPPVGAEPLPLAPPLLPRGGAVHHDVVHALQHFAFVACGFNMWMALLGPLPKPPWFGNLARLGYILAVRLTGAVLGNVFVFGGHVFFGVYAAGERAHGISPGADQNAAGAIMMVEGSILTLALFGWLFARTAQRGRGAPGAAGARGRARRRAHRGARRARGRRRARCRAAPAHRVRARRLPASRNLNDVERIRVGELTWLPLRRALGVTGLRHRAVDGRERRRRAHRVATTRRTPARARPRGALPRARRAARPSPSTARRSTRRRARCVLVEVGTHARGRGGRAAHARARPRRQARRGAAALARSSTTTPPSRPTTPATTTAPWRSRARAWPTGPTTRSSTTSSPASTPAPGRLDDARRSLDIAFAGDERTRGWAAEDDDLAALRVGGAAGARPRRVRRLLRH